LLSNGFLLSNVVFKAGFCSKVLVYDTLLLYVPPVALIRDTPPYCKDGMYAEDISVSDDFLL
jgi:hypothetical protein